MPPHDVHLVHLYSAFRILSDFQMSLYNFFIFLLRPLFSYCVIPLFLKGSHPLPINSLGSIQVCHLIPGNTSFSFGLSMQHSFIHSLMAERSMVVGHVPTVHICSFMCTSHIGMTAHTPAFLGVREYSGDLLYAHMT